MQAVIFSFLIIVVCMALALAGDVAFTTCPSADRVQLRRFSISDCPDGSSECTFVKGQTYTFEIEGTNNAGEAITALCYKVFATLLIPITIVEGEACQNTTAPNPCPIENGAEVLWSIEEQIPTSTPSMSATVTARIWGNDPGTNAEAWGCASIRVRIVNAANNLKEFIKHPGIN